MSTAFKEAKETHLWLRLLKDSGITLEGGVQRLIEESEEIRNIPGKSIATAKKKEPQ